jgi:putative component of membrane protein insertase Oxa1/YidC/SpoIIIJ protein YidD
MISPKKAIRESVATAICLWTLCLPIALWARDPMVAPREEVQRRSQGGEPERRSSELPMRFLRDVVSKVDGARCPMYPTDTQFALEAARRHGPVVGLLFLVDRLFHEWSEMKRVQVVKIHGRKRFYDPLDANDFWLRDPERSHNSSGDKR